MTDPSSRMLALLSLLQVGRDWSGNDLADRLGVSSRTVRRDVDRLRRLGYPASTRPGPGGYYRLAAGAAMPPLLLADDEAIAVAASLRMSQHRLGDDDAGARARRKLEQVLPHPLRRQIEAVTAMTETAPDARPVIEPELLGTIAAAAAEHHRIRFSYRNRAQQTTPRLVDPYRQVFRRQHWYLLGWDVDRADWRTFRLDRVTAVEPLPHTYPVRELPAATAADYLDDNARAARHRAVLVFDAGAQQVGDLLTSADGTLEPIGPERCRYTTWVDSFEWLAVTTAILGIDFVVEEPAEFTGYCAALSARLARAATPVTPPVPSHSPRPAGR
jgi:predicted DNA-binding transcriptional regulator YafY